MQINSLQHNAAALGAQLQLEKLGGKDKKSTEKLSSGYRINRAADDAAGLSISEKMRSQIRALNKASDNCGDGISLVQVADGALGEVTDMIHRMKELTLKSYNDTLTQEDRLSCQEEVNNLLDEIDRIRESTEYNTKQLLNGNESVEKVMKTGTITAIPQWITSTKSLPAWVTADSKLTYGNSNVSAGTRQDVSRTVIMNENGINPGLPIEAYGPDSTVPNYKGPWTDTISDNAAATVDFSGLLSATGYDDLLDKLGELVGGGALCTNPHNGITQGVYFKVDGMYDISVKTDSSPNYIGSVNLTDIISEVQKEKIKDASTTQTPSMSLDDLKDKVAKSLASGVAAAASIDEKYAYVQGTVDAANPYKAVLYDLRDHSATRDSMEMDLKKDAKLSYTSYLAVEATMKMTVKEPLQIQAGTSAASEDIISLDLADLLRERLGLKGYSVFKDGYDSATEDQKWAESGDGSGYAMDANGNYYSMNGASGHYETRINRITEGYYVPGGEMIVGTTGNGDPQVAKTAGHFVATGYHDEEEQVFVLDSETTVYGKSDLSALDDALDKLLKDRSRLGAYQNRLEHAQLVNDNASENTQAGESRIRDTDMAKEVVGHSNNQILLQAAQSMLAQANQQKQGLLSLLQS